MNNVPSKAPAIDIDMLTMALQAADLDTTWWLDTHSGNVIPAPEADGDAVEQKLVRESQRSPERFIEIDPVTDLVHLELMESYIATLEQAEICESLYEALQRKPAAWHFKNILASAPESEDNWYAFKEQFYALQARQWLRDRGLESREVPVDNVLTGNNQPQQAVTGDAPSCLELTLGDSEPGRRYLIWQRDGQLLLTVYTRSVQGDEQSLAEIEINVHQLTAISRAIETFHPTIEIQRPEVEAPLDASLWFSNMAYEGRINGTISENSLFKQLASQLDMLLGIPSL